MTRTIQDLAKQVADEFNKTIKEDGFENFEEMRKCYCWEAADIRDEIYATVRDLFNQAYEQGDKYFADYYDDCSMSWWAEDRTYGDMTYGQFKKLVFEFVM